jgi:methyl coenzyme M reductase subunit D
MPPAEAPPRPDRTDAARRTVVIRGQVAPPRASAGPARRRPPRRPSERIAGARPDRAALWAVMMGVFLILVAVMTAHGA